MKRTTWLIGIAVTGGCVVEAGCGEPQYPFNARKTREPGNRVTVRRDVFGAEASIENTSNTDAEMEGFKLDPKTGEISVRRAAFKSEQDRTLNALLPLMTAFVAQQQAYAQVRTAEWQGFNQALGVTIGGIAPVAQQYIATRGNVALQRALRPTAVQEIVALIRGGQVDPIDTISRLDRDAPELGEAVRTRMLGGAPLGSAPARNTPASAPEPSQPKPPQTPPPPSSSAPSSSQSGSIIDEGAGWYAEGSATVNVVEPPGGESAASSPASSATTQNPPR